MEPSNPRKKNTTGGSLKSGVVALWERQLTQSASGGFKPSTGNLATILQNHPAWRDVLWLNERGNRLVFRNRPPLPDYGSASLPHEITDTDMARIAVWFEHSDYRIVVTHANPALWGAVAVAAEDHRFDPVREYLDHLEWDGQSRLDQLFDTYMVADDQADGEAEAEYRKAVGAKFMISAVARTYKPGCKAYHVLVLVGAQGLRKSTALAVLGGDHFGDGLPDLKDKDSMEYLQALWIVEVAEFDALNRSGVNRVKAFLSRTHDRYRAPYGRRSETHPRRAVFSASTNDETFLRDATGNRRFWPVSVASVNLEALSRDRDQLWAEAKHRYLAGEPWYLTDPQLISAAVAEQDRRFERDLWHDKVAAFADGRAFVTVAGVLQGAVGIEVGRAGQREQNRVVAILKALGWSRVQRTVSGKKTWGYVPAES